MSELAKKDELLTVNTDDAIIQIIGQMATDPNSDVDKMERMLAMHERVLDRKAEAEFAQAMTTVQGMLPNVVKDADNTQTRSKYSTHEAISKAIKPVYTKEGFSITFSEDASPKEGHIRIIGILRHKSGHSETHHLDLPIDTTGIQGKTNKTGIHGTGSTYSYGRRYLTCMIFDVTTGDDNDGNVELEFITPEQVIILEKWIQETGSNEKAFLQYCGVSALANLSVNNFDKALNALKSKGKAK